MILDQRWFDFLSFSFKFFLINNQNTLNKLCIEEKLQLKNHIILILLHWEFYADCLKLSPFLKFWSTKNFFIFSKTHLPRSWPTWNISEHALFHFWTDLSYFPRILKHPTLAEKSTVLTFHWMTSNPCIRFTVHLETWIRYRFFFWCRMICFKVGKGGRKSEFAAIWGTDVVKKECTAHSCPLIKIIWEKMLMKVHSDGI